MKRWFVSALAALVLAGCASTTTPERFYRLPMPALGDAAGATTGKPATIAVGQVGLPELFDRPQLVTVGASTQVQIWESQRWAEPLREGIGRALAARLAAELAPAEVLAFPLVGAETPAYRVSVNVLRFDGELGRGVDDAWQWTVRRVADGQQRSGRGAAQAAARAGGHEALVAAHGAALDAMAREVAQAIRELSGAAHR